MKVTACLEPFIQSAMYFQTYTEIFTHMDNLCAFAQAEVFQTESLQATANLYDASVDTVSILRNLHVEEEARFHRIFDNMGIIESKIDQVKSIDLEILFQIFTLKTMWYYVALGMFAYFATTSIPRTQKARLPLMCWVAFAAVSEHYLLKKYPQDEHLVEMVEKFRYCVIAAAFVIMINAISSYQDVGRDTLKHVEQLRTSFEMSNDIDKTRRMISSLSRSMRIGGRSRRDSYRNARGALTKSKAYI